jgi:predicted transcriptional regulator
MARPTQPHPTAGELELLRILWEHGPQTVREVLQRVPEKKAYTSVMSLLNVMAEKKLVTRKPDGRAFRYTAKLQPEKTERKILGNVLKQVFDGSSSALVARLLEQSKPSECELEEIRAMIDEYKRKKK